MQFWESLQLTFSSSPVQLKTKLWEERAANPHNREASLQSGGSCSIGGLSQMSGVQKLLMKLERPGEPDLGPRSQDDQKMWKGIPNSLKSSFHYSVSIVLWEILRRSFKIDVSNAYRIPGITVYLLVDCKHIFKRPVWRYCVKSFCMSLSR